jgi:hypothetical protein
VTLPEITFRGGRLPNDPNKARVALRPFLRVDEVPPPRESDRYSQVPSWPMFLNDKLGDCTCADLGHTLQQTALYGDGAEVHVTDDDVLTAYKAVSGYNGDPSTDQGAVIQDVMNYWRTTGVAGHKSLAFAEVNVKDVAEVKAAINLFGSVHFGLLFPAFAMDQFNAGQPWTPATRNTTIEGGHDVVGVGYDPQWLYVVTWGRVQKVAWTFVARYFEEAWVAVIPEWVNDASGRTPTGLDLHGLGAEVAALTGGENPFPENPPEPPPPGDGLPPAVVDAVRALLADTRLAAWAAGRHTGDNRRAARAVDAIFKASEGTNQ